MKFVVAMVVLIALSVPMIASAQDSSGQSGSQAQTTPNSSQTSSGSQGNSNNSNMSGKVSHDGKTFVSDTNNNSYKVSNPDAVQAYEDQHVALVVHVDPDTNTIHIIHVLPPQ
jgi:hypothetical protein